MRKILFINACFRPESRTRILADRILEKLDGEVTVLNLDEEQILPLTLKTMRERDALKEADDYHNELFRYAWQFAEADEIVLAAPYYDMSFPASVKAYIEAISVRKITYTYTDQGIPWGLCRANRLIYVTTAGGPLFGSNLGFDYIKAVAGTYYGIRDFLYFQAENLDVEDADVDKILRSALNEIENCDQL